ncbi:MAG TPA: ABC transporter substrate-binding protein, partial [bacterium]|nr:ABC transporter substrate-binding protein [bacterium]
VESGQIAPELAAHWTVSPDGTVYTFELNSGVLFPSGVELSADDVVWSYRRLKYLHDRPSRSAEAIADVRALEHYVVRITLTRPMSDFLSVLASPEFAILDGRTVLDHGGVAGPEAATGDTATSWLNTHSAGTGPWMLVSYTPHREAILAPNPNYWRGTVYQGRVIFKNDETAASRLRDVETGRADVALGLTASEAAAVRESRGVQLLGSAAGPVPVRNAVHGIEVAPVGILELRAASKE